MTDMHLALAVFVVAFALIASDKINKILVSLLGAALVVGFQIMDQAAAFAAIDWEVITLLISMMILVNIIDHTGVFQYGAVLIAKRMKGSPGGILVALFLFTCLVSAFLPNLTAVLVIAPISIYIAKELGISAMPYLLAILIGGNLGGTATLIGDPPNMMIGLKSGLSFMSFLFVLGPVILLEMAVFSLVFFFLFRKQMHVTNENRARIMDMDEKVMIKNKSLLIRSAVVFTGIMVGFMFDMQIKQYINPNLEMSTIAFTGTMILLLISKIEPEKILEKVEWGTIFFFAGLFILVHSLEVTGVVEQIGGWLATVVAPAGQKPNIGLATGLIVWFSGILSAIIDNIPYVATMIPVVKDMGVRFGADQVVPIWWALSLGACLGGNGTLIGASSNIVVADIAKRNGYNLTFVSYLKYGVPMTVLSIAISHLYLMVRYFWLG
jgi:Na+/H+ antiporter NhaD/arsenite permease-like protein